MPTGKEDGGRRFKGRRPTMHRRTKRLCAHGRCGAIARAHGHARTPVRGIAVHGDGLEGCEVAPQRAEEAHPRRGRRKTFRKDASDESCALTAYSQMRVMRRKLRLQRALVGYRRAFGWACL